MNPLVLVGVGALALFALAKSDAAPAVGASNTGVPARLLSRMAQAMQRRDTALMRSIAAKLRNQGFAQQATELEFAARELERLAVVPPGPPVSRSPGQPQPSPRPVPVTPIVDVPVRPPDTVPVEPVRPPPVSRSPGQPQPSPRPVPVTPIVDVPVRPPDTVPVEPVPEPEEDRRIPASVADPLTRQFAEMVWALSDGMGPPRAFDAEQTALSERFKRATGVVGQGKFYGAGPAQALIARGVVPPTPRDWVNPAPADKAKHRNRLKFMANEDPTRADLWLAAAGAF